MKIINNWLFTNQLWSDSTPTPIAINMNNISYIGESNNSRLGTLVEICINNTSIAIEGKADEIITAIYDYQKREYYNNN